MGSSEVRYGFLTGIIAIVWALIPLVFKWTGTGLGDFFDYTGVIIIGVGIYYAVKDKKAEQGVLFTFNKAFFSGLVTCFVIAILMGSFGYVYAKYIDPGQLEARVKEGIGIMTGKKYTAEQIQRGVMNIRAMYSPNGQFMSGSGSTMLYGVIVSAVIGVYMTKRKPETTK